MRKQLIFLVEADSNSKSDWIYVKNTIDRFYMFDYSKDKLSKSFMGGKYKYKTKEKEIQTLIRQFSIGSKDNESYVFYVVDCDDYDSNPRDASFLEEIEDYCNQHNYNLIWFCKDVEQVYINKKVAKKEKKDEAERFAKNRKIQLVDETKLREENYRRNTSNILSVLDRYITTR